MDAVLSPSPVAPTAALLSLVIDRAAAAVADAADLSRVEATAGEAVADRADMERVEAVAVERILDRTDASDIARHVDLSDLAGEVDLSDLAAEIDVSDVASAVIDNLDLSDLAGEVDLSDLAGNIDLAALAGEMEDRRESDLIDRIDDLAVRLALLEEREPAEAATMREQREQDFATVREPVQFGPPAAAPVNEALLAAVRDATVAALIAALNAAAAEGRL